MFKSSKKKKGSSADADENPALTKVFSTASMVRGTGLKRDGEKMGWCRRIFDPLVSCKCKKWPSHAEISAILEEGDVNKENLAELTETRWSTCFFRILHWFPLVNYFYFAFFQKSIGSFAVMATVDSLGEIGLLTGTVAALFYTVMTAMPTSVSWDEFDTVDRHWSSGSSADWANFTNGVVGCENVLTLDFDSEKCWKALTPDKAQVTKFSEGIEIGKYGCIVEEDSSMPWRPVSVRIGNQMSESANWLLFSVVLSVIFVISVQSLSKVPEKIGSMDMAVPEDAIEAWFFYGKWVILASILMLVWGALQAVFVIGDVMYVKFPQPWLETLCEQHGWNPVLDALGNHETFDTMVEIPAGKYSGGRYVSYVKASSWERWEHEEIVRGDVTTIIRDLDPMAANGKSYWLMGLWIVLGLLFCGYGAACADTQTKEEANKLLNKVAPKETVANPNFDQPTREMSDSAKAFDAHVQQLKSKNAAVEETDFGTRTETYGFDSGTGNN